jgi:hypothetical protein
MRLFPRRLYKSGTGWCLWRWTDVPSSYIVRLHIFKTPWFAICLHWINGPDAEPHLHDHPVSFLSIILRGWYRERRVQSGKTQTAKSLSYWTFDGLPPRRRFNFIRASREDRHKIVEVAPGTLTLALMGPKVQEWGFHTPEGWVYWKDYNREKYR